MNRAIPLPEEPLKWAEELAAREHLPAEEFLSAQLSEQFSGLEYLKQRADRAGDKEYQAALGMITEGEPADGDRM